jgi:hypothetical protein
MPIGRSFLKAAHKSCREKLGKTLSFLRRGFGMLDKYLLGTLLALFGLTGFARAQAILGSPISGENAPGGSARCAPALFPLSGHLMPPRCDEALTRDDVSRMIIAGGYSPAEITAVKVKIDEAQASARRAAVKYLATINCYYFPEAESALIAALRTDCVEIVRYEAALGLGNGPALTEKMLEALNMTALGLSLDGNPVEASEQVREAARHSLRRCSSRGLCFIPPACPMVRAGECMAPDYFMIPSSGYNTPAIIQAAAPVPQHERELAETISASPKNTVASRPLWHFLRNLAGGRETGNDSRVDIDPRLRGLKPIGSEATLAIPRYPPAATIMPMPPYNYRN